MKRILFWLALSACPGAGGTRQAPVAPIALVTHFEQAPSAGLQDVIESELGAIMHPLGLHFDWRPLMPNDNAAAVELVVVTFRGHCSLGSEPPSPSATGALGWTHVSNGVVLPFSEVDCDAVRAFLQRSPVWHGSSERLEIFGRALARVLAHELYHVMAGTSEHGECGIAKSGFTVEDLLAPEFTFEASELHRLLESRSYKILQKAALQPPMSP